MGLVCKKCGYHVKEEVTRCPRCYSLLVVPKKCEDCQGCGIFKKECEDKKE